jgi:HAMP domain-containing protein
VPIDITEKQREIDKSVRAFTELAGSRRNVRTFYLLFMAMITLFVLFVATWIALFLSKQISTPITALLHAAGEVSKGNLKHRVQVRAIDELASLVRGFNEMTQELEANSRELDARRRFTEAILESIPTGVISIGADGYIRRVNRALGRMFPAAQLATATRLEDLFSREDTAEIKYLMKRARRTGLASRQLEMQHRTPDHAPGRDRLGAGREADFRLRDRAGGHQRIAARAKGRRLARSGAARGARDQESADPHGAFRRAHEPPVGTPADSAGKQPHPERVRRAPFRARSNR